MKLLHDYVLVEKIIKEDDDEALIKIPDTAIRETGDLVTVKIIDVGPDCSMIEEENIKIGDKVLVENYMPCWTEDDRFIIREDYIKAVIDD